MARRAYSSNTTSKEDELQSQLPSPVMRLFWSVAFSVEALLIVACNVITILSFLKNRQLRKRSVYLLVNLSFADLFVGSVSLPAAIYYIGEMFDFWGHFDGFTIFFHEKKYKIHQSIKAFFNFSLLSFTLGISMFSLVIISLERLVATVWPLRHRNTRTWMYGLAICLVWLFPIPLTGITLCNLEVGIVISFSVGIASLLTICTSYISIFLKVKHQNVQHAHSTLQKTIQQERELAKTVLLVSVVSVSCWLPIAGYVLNGKIRKVSGDLNVLLGVFFIAFLNSVTNPVLYAFRMPLFRETILKMVCKCGRNAIGDIANPAQVA